MAGCEVGRTAIEVLLMQYPLDRLEMLLFRQLHLIRVLGDDGPVGVELPAVIRVDWVDGSRESAGDEETKENTHNGLKK